MQAELDKYFPHDLTKIVDKYTRFPEENIKKLGKTRLKIRIHHGDEIYETYDITFIVHKNVVSVKADENLGLPRSLMFPPFPRTFTKILFHLDDDIIDLRKCKTKTFNDRFNNPIDNECYKKMYTILGLDDINE